MRADRVSWKLKCFYGLGQAAESIKNFGFGTLPLLLHQKQAKRIEQRFTAGWNMLVNAHNYTT